MKEIKLNKGKIALIDDEDFDEISKYKWHYDNGYAVRSVPNRNKYRMHRVILKLEESLPFVDHINCDRLDNRKENLRTCTRTQNSYNTKLSKSNTSGFRGVYFCNRRKKFKAHIKINGKDCTLGFYDCPLLASEAYKEKAKEVQGCFMYKDK